MLIVKRFLLIFDKKISVLKKSPKEKLIFFF